MLRTFKERDKHCAIRWKVNIQLVLVGREASGVPTPMTAQESESREIDRNTKENTNAIADDSYAQG